MRSKLSNSLWGIFFLIIGLGFLGNVLFGWDFSIFFDGWWTMFIIIPSVISIIQNGFHVMNITSLCIGGLLFLSSQGIFVSRVNIFRLFFPMIFIVLGINILFRNVFNTPKNWDTIHAKHSKSGTDYTAIFSSQNILYPNEVFYSATINAVFGSAVLDLRNAVITEDCAIDISAVFGGGDIYIPSNVKVKVSSVPIFGGVSNKTMQTADSNAPTLYINATCIFGGIDIK